MGSPEMQRIQACARENNIAVSLGFSENSNNSLFIAQVLIGADGEIKFYRRKMKGTHMERTVFGDASGHCLQSVAQLPFGRVGSLNCWEHLQPLLKYHTITQNEDIHIAAWPPLSAQVGEYSSWSMTAEGVFNSRSSPFAILC
jgi:predicted amidohydrolase